jgi:DNA uptake protein ComE-like DNA-binding protein
LAHLQETIAKSPETARAALGPNVWLFRATPAALAINLNTAEREALLELPGVDASVADRALESRRAKGPFKDVDDFVKRSGVGASAVAQFADMIDAMARVGTFARE